MTAVPDEVLRWYLRSMADQDTHRGTLDPGGVVKALCGAVFAPKPTLRTVGPPPGMLVDGPVALAGAPPDPAQACQRCKELGHG